MDRPNRHCLQQAVVSTYETFNDVIARLIGIAAVVIRAKPHLKDNDDPIVAMELSLVILQSMTEALQQVTRSIQNLKNLCVETDIGMPTKHLLNNISCAIMSNMPDFGAQENPEQLINLFLHMKSRIEFLLDEMKRVQA
jgi:hypothetical protein